MQVADCQQKIEYKPEFMDKTIRADEAAYEGFRQLAKECHLSNAELLAAMVQYFKVTKADPREPTGPDLTTLLAKLGAKIDGLGNRTIGFIREQEKQYLKPILAQVDALQVLSSPAPDAPASLSAGQVKELGVWFMRVILAGMRPDLLSPEAVAKEPELSATMKGVEQDPALIPIRGELLNVLRLSFQSEVRTGVLRDKPPIQPA